ncbi:hypothetical protein NDN08_003496 [Rhodosorus marinus]|uniref:Uncharacterized protein n=1 Tax=Rhodosorus marinus TaxID=101924 RepID=A0AAV8V0S9_9RHOD|nr:hypothetical protein NDN08_003496 [Rhodosorus marinus]
MLGYWNRWQWGVAKAPTFPAMTPRLFFHDNVIKSFKTSHEVNISPKTWAACLPKPAGKRSHCSPSPQGSEATVRQVRREAKPLFAKSAGKRSHCSPSPQGSEATVRQARREVKPLFAKPAGKRSHCSPSRREAKPLFAKPAGGDAAQHSHMDPTLS